MNSTEAIDNWRRELASNQEPLWKAVTFALQLFEMSGIPKGRSNFSLENPNAIAFYVQDCLDLGITPQTILDHHQAVRRSLQFWPSSTEFARAFAEFRRSIAIPGEHVGYIVNDEGVSTIVDRRTHPAAATSEHEAKQLAQPDRKSLC